MNDQATKFVLGEQLRPYSNAIRALDTLETGPLLGFADWPIGNRSLMDQLAAHTSPPGAIGLGAQILCHVPGHSGLAAVRQAFRPAKYRRSLDRNFW